MKERQRRVDRRRAEKKRKQREAERLERKKAIRKAAMMIEDAEEAYGDSMMRGYDDDEGHEDILNFKDSERESLISYMHSTAALDNK